VEDRSTRACLVAFLAAAALSLANVVIGFADTNSDDPQSVSDYAAVTLFSAALVGASAALAVLRRLRAGSSRSAPSVGLGVAAAGAALAGVGNLIEDGLGISAFGLLFALGGLVLVIGLLTAATMVLTTGWPLRWVGIGLVLLAVGFAIGEEPGFALVGVTWLVLALVLVSPRSRAHQA
jgi:peptidoglycan/LPS O-acetylase OafA/YrhL